MTWGEEDAQLEDSMSLLKNVRAQRTDLDGAAPDDSTPHLDDKLWETIGNILDNVNVVMTGQPLDDVGCELGSPRGAKSTD